MNLMFEAFVGYRNRLPVLAVRISEDPFIGCNPSFWQIHLLSGSFPSQD